YKEYKCLLAAEVVQLLCIVPAFFDFIEKDNGIINLLIAATSDNSIIHKIGNIVDKARSNKNDVRRLYEDLAKFILQCIQRNAKNVINKQISPRSQSKFVLSNGLPKRPHSSPIYSPLSTSDYIAKGRSTPDHRRVRPLTARKWKEFDTIKTPMLGDKVLAGPQNVGYIIALPELDIALIQMDAVPAPNGAVGVLPKNIEAHYNYMDMKQLEWNRSGYWRPKGTIGD
ncbi:uncharacterized protein LOC102807247, partial [Saccoglossus kowalevskii]|uniref:Uncharacterized protein LOC102807247 n=1 Tax=Saccoglossus kowalevskii TaxID=10224 RepID=A0ABM0MXT0_SACKO